MSRYVRQAVAWVVMAVVAAAFVAFALLIVLSTR